MDKVQEILSQVDFLELVGRKTTLTKFNTNSYKGLSPFTSEKTPSFFVNTERNVWYCYSSGFSGGVIDFISRSENLTRKEALHFLAEYVGIPLDDDEDVEEYAALRRTLSLAHAIYLEGIDKAEEYLSNRGILPEMVRDYAIGFSEPEKNVIERLKAAGISEDTIVSSGVGFRRDNGSVGHRFDGRVIFPIYNEYGTLVSFSGRKTDSTGVKYMHGTVSPLFHKKHIVWGLTGRTRGLMDDNGYVIACEGPIDAISLSQNGIPAVAILGSSISEEQVYLLSRFTQNVYFTFDSDAAGKKGLERAFELLQKVRTDAIAYAITLPSGYDPDTYLAEYGKDKFLELKNDATSDTSYIIELLIKKHNKGGSNRNLVASKVIKDMRDMFPQELSYRGLDVLERMAATFAVDRARLHKWVKNPTKLTSTLVSTASFEAPIYERRILYAVLTDPTLIVHIINNNEISWGDFESSVISNTLMRIKPHYTSEQIFEILRAELKPEEYDTIMKFYTAGISGGNDFHKAFDVMKLRVLGRQHKAGLSNTLRKAPMSTHVLDRGTIRSIIREPTKVDISDLLYKGPSFLQEPDEH